MRRFLITALLFAGCACFASEDLSKQANNTKLNITQMERYLKAIQQNVLYEVIISKEDKSKKREMANQDIRINITYLA